jgi:hypothetical protein
MLITGLMHSGDDFFDERYGLKFGIAIGVTVLMWIPVYVINRYFPFIVGKRKNS